MDYDTLLEKAKLKAYELPLGTEFTLRNLFQGTFWNELEVGVRLEFGRRFKYAVTSGAIPCVIYIGKNASNASLYQKQSIYVMGI